MIREKLAQVVNNMSRNKLAYIASQSEMMGDMEPVQMTGMDDLNDAAQRELALATLRESLPQYYNDPGFTPPVDLFAGHRKRINRVVDGRRAAGEQEMAAGYNDLAASNDNVMSDTLSGIMSQIGDATADMSPESKGLGVAAAGGLGAAGLIRLLKKIKGR